MPRHPSESLRGNSLHAQGPGSNVQKHNNCCPGERGQSTAGSSPASQTLINGCDSVMLAARHLAAQTVPLSRLPPPHTPRSPHDFSAGDMNYHNKGELVVMSGEKSCSKCKWSQVAMGHKELLSHVRWPVQSLHGKIIMAREEV